MRLLPILLCLALPLAAQDEPAAGGRGGRGDEPINAMTFAGLRARNIGPAFISGRVSQIAVFPDSSSHYLVAEASGNVFLTYNNGTTWTPVFDTYGSYSIGYIAIDPKNPSTVWLGSGENNDQRSVSYGDGVYKSDDGGRTWRNVGLKQTEHIARIVIDPRDSNVVYVAAPGPLWKGGGERGLYKTTDGGKTWSQSLIKVGEYTGCSDVVMDPRNPDHLFAATHQRERRYFGMIHGGPESGLWHSVDARQDLDRGARRVPHGRTGTDRAQLRAVESGHPLRAGGRAGRPRRPVPQRRQRRHLGEAQQLRRAGPVLLQSPGGPGQPGPRLRDERQHHGVGRRRAHPGRAADAQQARGQPRDLGRSEEQQSLHGGLRRRPLRELRPRRDVDLQGQPADHPVVRRGGERGRAVLFTSTAARRTTTASAARRAPRTPT